MDNENVIPLSGPFRIHDSLGMMWSVKGIRIYDEGYGIIDVYVDFDKSMEDAPLHEDPLVIQQIVSRLRTLGYDGPDFGPGDPGLQDERLIVLEAPEEFCHFAAGKGWRNLAEDFVDGDQQPGPTDHDVMTDPAARAAFNALMRKIAFK